MYVPSSVSLHNGIPAPVVHKEHTIHTSSVIELLARVCCASSLFGIGIVSTLMTFAATRIYNYGRWTTPLV